MKTPYSLSDSELREYSDHHLKYELEMLLWCTAILNSLAETRKAGALPLAINNAVMNSFSMHARNLIDFLYLRSLGKDRGEDIIIEDFIELSQLANCLPVMTPLLEEAKHKTDKQVAHLSKNRIQYEQVGKEWMVSDIVLDLIKAFHATSGRFPPERTGESFLALISKDHLLMPLIQSVPLQDEKARNKGIEISLGKGD